MYTVYSCINDSENKGSNFILIFQKWNQQFICDNSINTPIV